MKHLSLLFCGVFFAIALCFAGLILSSNIQIGALEPRALAEDDPLYPKPKVGLAQQGKQVYKEMGCAYCHTQQVSRKGLRADYERGWGRRQTVARDYIRQERVLLGNNRVGPDLSNFGDRIFDTDPPTEAAIQAVTQELHRHLYNPQMVNADSNMPPHPFLYQKRKIKNTPSPKALQLSAGYAPKDGYEIVPTARAEALVAYLLSLRLDYELPESKFVQEEK